MDTRLTEQVRQAADVLRRARNTVALTGAGVSVASGIPDFRSPGGLWSRSDPMEVASAEALEDNPRGVWEFLLEARRLMDGARPNPAHQALARLESEPKSMAWRLRSRVGDRVKAYLLKIDRQARGPSLRALRREGSAAGFGLDLAPHLERIAGKGEPVVRYRGRLAA